MNQIPEVLPHDVHNATLVSNVHPLDWQNPEPAPRYNLVVIGAGTAGLVTAAGLPLRRAWARKSPSWSGTSWGVTVSTWAVSLRNVSSVPPGFMRT